MWQKQRNTEFKDQVTKRPAKFYTYNMIKFFRIVGLLEGLSYILLLFVGVPMKYIMGNPTGVKALGMPHGLLFVLYIVLAVNVFIELEWPKRRLFYAFLASLLPFGTLIFDWKYLKKNN
jgi:integral membrane protein